MKQVAGRVFAHIPRTGQGHFVILLYAAVYRLLNHIRRLNSFGGEPLEQMFERYPFLSAYFAEMRGQMPEDIGWEAGIDWWRSEIAGWESQCCGHLPLRTLTRQMGLDFDVRLGLLLIGLIEEDSRFGTLFAELQAPLSERRPTLELIGQMLKDVDKHMATTDAWSLCRPLLANGLIEALNRQAPRAEWVLRVPPSLWDAARGQPEVQPIMGCHYHPAETFPTLDELIFAPNFLQRLEQVPVLVETGKARVLLLRSDPGGEPQEVLGALSRRLGLGLLSIDSAVPGVEQSWEALAALCTMNRCLPVLSYDPGPGETIELPSFPGYRGPLGVILGQEGGLAGRSVDKTLTLTLPPPVSELRRRHWCRVLNERVGDDLDNITEAFHLSGGYIRQIGRMALAHAGLDARETVRLEDVREASRALNCQQLDTLAGRLETTGSWNDLIVADATMSKLAELSQRCRHRERLLAKLGPAFSGNANRGVRALLTGVSGTGKTLAARILAAELGMDLYRVDLAAVINKYIGETEKNLHQVLSRAEALDVILLLDEGDALLGSRTQVKSANDRYANLETNYLLQRLENYQGIVVVTTNLAENIDRAFQRRMDVIVPFLVPQAQERRQILQLHLPLDHAVDADYLERVARRCALSGGQLRNVAQHAALLALEEQRSVTRYHLEQALKSEYRKVGGTFPLADAGFETADEDGGMAAFVGALQGY